MNDEELKNIRKFIKLSGERAKLDAKANNTYVIYKNDQGKVVKEYADGTIEFVKREG